MAVIRLYIEKNQLFSFFICQVKNSNFWIQIFLYLWIEIFFKIFEFEFFQIFWILIFFGFEFFWIKTFSKISI